MSLYLATCPVCGRRMMIGPMAYEMPQHNRGDLQSDLIWLCKGAGQKPVEAERVTGFDFGGP